MGSRRRPSTQRGPALPLTVPEAPSSGTDRGLRDAASAPRVDALLAGLDEAQRRCVTDPARVVVVEAGPGSGKTRVLTHRLAYRAARGDLDPARAVVVTFTRRAAEELRRRSTTLQVGGGWYGTVHRLARRVLLDEAEHRGRQPLAFASDPLGLLAEAAGADDAPWAPSLASEAAWLASLGLDPTDYPDACTRARRRPPLDPERVAEVLARYETLKRRRGVIDAADLPRLAAEALHDPALAGAVRWRHQHLLVDEAQDLTPAQWAFLRGLAGEDPDLFLVGDPDQTIYGFNGADSRFLTATEQWVAAPSRHRLTRNYRAAGDLVRLAGQLRAHLGFAEGAAEGGQDLPASVELLPCADPAAEAREVTRRLRLLRAAGWGWSTMAVLARTRDRLRLVEDALLRAGVPVRTGRSLLEEPAVREVLEQLDLARPRPPLVVLADLEECLAVRQDPEAVADQLLVLRDLVAEWAEQRRAGAHPRGLRGWLRAELSGPDGLQTVSRTGVELATFHRAKGTEFAHVVLLGLEDGMVPLANAEDPKEEARLFYVACTRAERSLLASWTGRASPWLPPLEEAADALAHRARPARDRQAAKARIAALRDRLAGLAQPA